MHIMRHSGIALLTALCLGGSAGCIYIPVPKHDSGKARTNVSDETANLFTPGQTTRRDVILVLGEPDTVSLDERLLAFQTEKVKGYFIMAIPAGADAAVVGGAIADYPCFVAEFDDQGVLKRFEKNWMDSLPGIQPVSTYKGKVVHLQEHARWYAGIDGYPNKDVGGTPGQILLTDTDLIFITVRQLANAEPELIIPYSTLVEEQFDALGFFKFGRVVVRTETGSLNTFEILSPKHLPNIKATQQFREFLQQKLQEQIP